MSLFVKLLKQPLTTKVYINYNAILPVSLHQTNVESIESLDNLKPLNLKQKKGQIIQRKKFRKMEVLPPRANQMPVDQDWSNVWPGPRTFHPATVPLPVHQGYVEKGAAPNKYANTELMKIPNFLHLTPPVIQRQCEALKKFCTPWPKGLETEELQEKHLPLEIIYSDYCHSSPTIRDPLSRIVTIKIKLKSLNLNNHARDKLLRLVGDRYDETTDTLTIVTDRCPTRKQNHEYAMYLLTALYYESWKIESWEQSKTEEDMEYYDWEQNISKKNVEELCKRNEINDSKHVEEYKNIVIDLWNKGENNELLGSYNKAVRQLLNVPSLS